MPSGYCAPERSQGVPGAWCGGGKSFFVAFLVRAIRIQRAPARSAIAHVRTAVANAMQAKRLDARRPAAAFVCAPENALHAFRGRIEALLLFWVHAAASWDGEGGAGNSPAFAPGPAFKLQDRHIATTSSGRK